MKSTSASFCSSVFLLTSTWPPAVTVEGGCRDGLHRGMKHNSGQRRALANSESDGEPSGFITDNVPVSGKDFKTVRTLMRTIPDPGLKSRMLSIRGWFSSTTRRALTFLQVQVANKAWSILYATGGCSSSDATCDDPAALREDAQGNSNCLGRVSCLLVRFFSGSPSRPPR